MKIKDKWSDITIAEYERIVDIINRTDDEIERLTGVISVLSGVDEDEIADMPIAEIARIGQKLDFLNSFDFNKNATYKSLVIDGETLVLAVKDMSVAQYVDFQATWSAETKDLARIISICYVPKGKIYNKDYDIEELIKKIRNNVSIDKANSIGFFAQEVKRINNIHSSLFGDSDEVSGDEDSAGDDRAEDANDEAFSLFVWFGLIDTYCETTRETFDEAWQTEINYFLTVIEYAIEKNRKLLEKQKQMRLQL